MVFKILPFNFINIPLPWITRHDIFSQIVQQPQEQTISNKSANERVNTLHRQQKRKDKSYLQVYFRYFLQTIILWCTSLEVLKCCGWTQSNLDIIKMQLERHTRTISDLCKNKLKTSCGLDYFSHLHCIFNPCLILAILHAREG